MCECVPPFSALCPGQRIVIPVLRESNPVSNWDSNRGPPEGF